MISSVTSTKAARLAAVDAGIIRLIVHGQQVHASDQHIQQSAAEALVRTREASWRGLSERIRLEGPGLIGGSE